MSLISLKDSITTATYFLMALLISTSGCDWREGLKPSVVIFAVEGLSADDLDCSTMQDTNSTGFSRLCNQAVSFNHAYTTSTLSQPALASILTGLYPYEHLVRHNGNNFLDEKFELISELALNAGYRTSFFSGGPPIWRKSGFDQGFELFDDNVDVTPNHLFRSVESTIEAHKRWVQSEASNQPVFSVIYLPDLQFPRVTTKDAVGVARGRGRDAQKQEIAENIDLYIDYLTQEKRWFNTHLVVVGLNGKTERFSETELPGLNLHSENTQVTLLWKPARKSRDEVTHWSIGPNVSLIDIYETIKNILSTNKTSSNEVAQNNRLSLAASFQKPNVDWDRDRIILTESAWAQWHNQSPIRYALRKNSYLMIYDVVPEIYNTLNDQLEHSRMLTSDPTVRSVYKDFSLFIATLSLEPWIDANTDFSTKVRLAQELFVDDKSNSWSATLSILYNKNPEDTHLESWLSQEAIRNSNWKLLKKIAEKSKNNYLLNFANMKINANSKIKKDACDRAFGKESAKLWRQCQDEEWRLLSDWVHASDKNQNSTFERFLTKYNKKQFLNYVNSESFRLGLVWDVNFSDFNIMTRTDLFLNLPENEKLLKKIKKIK
jgi:hypothetical protein